MNKIQQHFYKKKKKLKPMKFDINTHLISEVTYQQIDKKILFLVTFWFFIKKYQHWSVFNRYSNLEIGSIFNIQDQSNLY